jgi:hypothetical protein
VDIKDEMEDPINVTFTTKGLDALRMGTAEAMREIMMFQQGAMKPRRGTGGAGFAGPVLAAGADMISGPMSMADKAAAAQKSKTTKKETAAALRKSKQLAYAASKRQRPKKGKGMTDEELLSTPLAIGAGLQGPEALPAIPAVAGGDMDTVDYLKEMVELIKEQNAMMGDAPDIQIDQAALAGG